MLPLDYPVSPPRSQMPGSEWPPTRDIGAQPGGDIDGLARAYQVVPNLDGFHLLGIPFHSRG